MNKSKLKLTITGAFSVVLIVFFLLLQPIVSMNAGDNAYILTNKNIVGATSLSATESDDEYWTSASDEDDDLAEFDEIFKNKKDTANWSPLSVILFLIGFGITIYFIIGFFGPKEKRQIWYRITIVSFFSFMITNILIGQNYDGSVVLFNGSTAFMAIGVIIQIGYIYKISRENKKISNKTL